jgi:hypothetical protein
MLQVFHIRLINTWQNGILIVLSYQGNTKQCLTDIIELYLKFERDY